MNENVQVRFGGDTSGLNGELNNLDSEFKKLFTDIRDDVRKMSGVVESELREINEAMRRTRQSGDEMGSMFSKIKGSVAGLAAGYGLTELGRYVINTTVEFERLRSVLTTLEGDASEARFADLKKFAAETPFDLQQVVTAFTKLKSQGLDPSSAAMRDYGNIASSMGKSMDQMIEAATDATVGEMERLKEFGIKAQQEGDKVTFIFKGVATTVGRNGEEIQGYLRKLSQENFGGAMERQMATLGGAFSNLGDTVATTADAIGQGGLSQALNQIARDMTETVSEGNGMADMLGGVLGEAVLAVWEIIKGFGEAVSIIFDAVSGIIRTVTGSTQSDGEIWKNTFRGVLTMINGFGVGVRVIFNAVAGVVAALGQTFVSFADIVNRVMQFDFDGAFQSFKNWGSNIERTAKSTAGNIVSSLVEGRKRMEDIYKDPPKKGPQVPLPDYKAPPKISPGGGGGGSKGNAKSEAAEAKRLIKDKLDAELEAIDAKQEAARDDFKVQLELQDQKLAAIKRVLGEDTKEYRASLREKAQLERRYAQEQVQIARERTETLARIEQVRADSEHELLRASIDEKKQLIEDQYSVDGKANQRFDALRDVLQQETQAEIEHEQRIYQIKLQASKDQLALINLQPQERRRMLAELEVMEVEHNARMDQLQQQQQIKTRQLNTQMANETRNRWMNAVQPIGQAFSGMLNGILTQGQTFRQSYIQMMDQLVTQFVNKGVEMLTNWISMELAKTSASQAAGAARVATDATTAATSQAITTAQGTAQVATNAAVGASGAYAATASIPGVGPFIAPAIAAAAMAAIMGFSSLISASGGYDIPSGTNPLVQAHEEEMILPAHIANPLRSMLSGPRQSNLSGSAASAGEAMRQQMSTTNGGDQYTFTYGPQHTNMGADMSTLLREDGASMRRWLRNEMRNGTLKMPRK